MNAPTDFQVIEQDGKPVFAVVPWDRFQEMAEAWQAVQAREQLTVYARAGDAFAIACLLLSLMAVAVSGRQE